jgi:very-short-patch-repair endonuclease
MAKFMMSDDSPKGRRRLANAKGFGAVEAAAGQAVENSLRKYAPSGYVEMPITRNSQFAGGGANVAITQPMFFSPLHTPQNWQIAQKRKEVYQWARFYYENEPKVAAGVDFYAQFPMNGFELECRNKKVRVYFENLVKELKLSFWLKLISHEYFLLGDVFPFLTIECDHCGGSGVLKSGKPCNHPDGRFKNITILNPDFIEVEDSPFPGAKSMYLIPEDNLKRLVQRRQPRKEFERIPPQMVELIASGQPIPLSPRSVSHIKHSEVPYSRYGTSLLRRLFTILAYKTKLMTANWIVAERLVLPVRVVKLGEKERPAGPDDIADMQNQLASVANDPNLTIVTHHAFDYEWYGASGKIHNIQGEWEQIGKEILDGLMLNQSLLNGEMAGYQSAQVGVETMIRRLENWRNTLSDWVEEHIFRPTAMMQGFIDEDATKQLGKTVYLYPTIKWNDMQLRDKTNKLQLLTQLHDKQIISTEKLCEEFDIDYDQEIERIRNEQMAMGPGGAMPGGGGAGGMPGAMGMGGPPPGGAPAPMDPMAGGGPGGAAMPGMMPGGAAGGGMAPGGGGAPPMGAAAGGGGGGGGSMKIHKRGKAPKAQEQQEVAPPTFVRLSRIEQRIWKSLQEMKLPYPIYGQHKQPVPGKEQPYVMDFAIPALGIDIEADGQIWHEQEGAQEKDAERDRALAQFGWRVLRFNEDAIMERMDLVGQEIHKNIMEAAQERFSQRKKASSDEGVVKYAATVAYSKDGSSLDWNGKDPSGVIQVIRGVIDVQPEANSISWSEEN